MQTDIFQPYIAGQTELIDIITVEAAPSCFLAVVPKGMGPLEALIAERVLLYSLAGETVLASALADLMRVTQEKILDVVELLKGAKLIEVNWLDITTKDHVIVHILGTKLLVQKLIEARDQLRVEGRKQLAKRLTKDEVEVLENDRQAALQAQRWTVADSVKISAQNRITPQDSSKAAIGARARRYAESQRAQRKAKIERLKSKREEFADKIRQNASGEFYFMLCGKRRTYPTQSEALDALVEVKASKF